MPSAMAFKMSTGPLTASNVLELGRVDILMMPIDARERYQVRARVAQHQDGRGEGAVLAAEYLATPATFRKSNLGLQRVG